MDAAFGRRIEQLKSKLRDLECWEVIAQVPANHWRDECGPLDTKRSWATSRRVYELYNDNIEIPEDWPIQDTRLQLSQFGHGEISLCTTGGGSLTAAVNDIHRRFHVPGRSFSAKLRTAPVQDKDTGYITLGQVGFTRLVLMEPAIEDLCRLAGLALGAACATRVPDVADAVLSLVENSVRLIAWPTAAGHVRNRLAAAEHLNLMWTEMKITPSADGLDQVQRASVRAAARHLRDGLRWLRTEWPAVGAVYMIGSAHVDPAWLWPREATAPSVIGHFSTAISQLERFEDYRFGQSSAQLYAMLEEANPSAFERLRRHVAADRWELLGGMWVEPDMNLLSGESIVRQLLHGQSYFMSRFARRSTVCWLPDTFGFSGALPQLLRSAGIEYFYTTKLRYNDTDKFPYDLFRWTGIDGSEVLAYLGPGPQGYRGKPDLETLTETFEAFRERSIFPAAFLPLGHSSGICPTDDEVSRALSASIAPGCPSPRFEAAENFFAAADRRSGLPKWSGELYLEAHRGTYTTHCKTKVLHRAAEWALIDAEAASSMLALREGVQPANLSALWASLLENQTHDIVTGVSVAEVHAAAESGLAGVITNARATATVATESLARSLAGPVPYSRQGVFLVNPTLEERQFRVFMADQMDIGQSVTGGCVVATADRVPPLGACWASSFDGPDVHIDGLIMDNGCVRVTFTDDGTLASIYDHRTRREMLSGPGNVLRAFLDRPHFWDAWELAPDYSSYPLEPPRCTRIVPVERGPFRAAFRLLWTFRNSEITQDVRLWAGSARIDFDTKIMWRERHVVLRSLFPVGLRTSRARYECAFGITERDAGSLSPIASGQFEVPAHRFSDVSDEQHGIALLNNGRYGHSYADGELGLTLLRSPIFPDPHADDGESRFCYAVLPHPGCWADAGVLAEAADLNSPLPYTKEIPSPRGAWRSLRIDGNRLGLGAFKGREGSDGLILRAYEPTGCPASVNLAMPSGWQVNSELNILEYPTGTPSYVFGPYQVRTWLLEPVRASHVSQGGSLLQTGS